MVTKIKHFTKEIFLTLLVITILANSISLYKSQDLNKKPLRQTSFKLIDNTNYTLKKDKPLLLHFWATWCPTCKLEADNIQRLSKHYQVLSIAVKSGNNTAIEKYMQERGFDFAVVNDKDAALAHKFHINAFPTTFIYDKNHHLKFSEVGYTSTLGLYLRMLWVSL